MPAQICSIINFFHTRKYDQGFSLLVFADELINDYLQHIITVTSILCRHKDMFLTVLNQVTASTFTLGELCPGTL